MIHEAVKLCHSYINKCVQSCFEINERGSSGSYPPGNSGQLYDLPIVLFPQICCLSQSGCRGIYIMLVKVFCEVQRGIYIYNLKTIIIGLEKKQ